jgi:hypothetical protein
MVQADHVVDARAKEIVGGGAGKHHGRTPESVKILSDFTRFPIEIKHLAGR